MITSSLIGLNRTEDPKYPHYYPDGAARDSFINANNGGFAPTVHAKGQSNEARFELSIGVTKPK